MDNEYWRKVAILGVLLVLLVLSFLILQPIIISLILGLIFALIFDPLYLRILKYFPYKNVVALLICTFTILIVAIPSWYLLPIFFNQSLQVYSASQQFDFISPIKALFPSLFSSQQFSTQISSIIQTFLSNATDSLVNVFSDIIFNLPSIFLQIMIVFATFFFVLRDKEALVSYIKSIMPFTKDVESKLFRSSKDLTLSVIYGQVVVGAVQGIIAGIGFFIFHVPNALLLTFLGIIVGILPIIGTPVVWIPVMIYLFVAGNNFEAFGVAFFGIGSSVLENILRPAIISKRTRMHPMLILIGMIGGLFYFGILGFILGPLIIAYVLIIIEIYRGKEMKGIFVIK